MADTRPHTDDPRSDEELMVAFRNGEGRAFAPLVQRYQRGLFNFILRSVQNRSRAEEMLQDVFMKVVKAKNRYEQTARFSTWIYTIARNLCVDESRRRKHRDGPSLDAPRGRGGEAGTSLLDRTAAKQIGTDAAAEGPRIQRRMAAAIERLPDDQREVFLMRQLSGLSFKQIGKVVGAPENTVKSRMRYALEKLRGDLKDLRGPT